MRTMNNFSSDQPIEPIFLTGNETPSAKKESAKPKAQDATNEEQGALQEQNRLLLSPQEIVEPSTTTDVVLGRGGFEGAIFKSVIESHAKDYLRSKQIHKSEMILEIYEELKNRKCRFIDKTHDSTMASKFIIVTDEHRVTNRIKRSMRSYLRKELKKDDAMMPPITVKKDSSTNKRTNESCPDGHDQRSKRQCRLKEASLKKKSSDSSKFPSIIGEGELFRYYNDALLDCESMIVEHEQDSWRTPELKETPSLVKYMSAGSIDSFSLPELKFTDSMASTRSMIGGKTTFFPAEFTPHLVPPKNKVPAVRKVSILERNKSLSTETTHVDREVSPVGVVDFPSASTTASPKAKSGTVSPDHDFMSLQKDSPAPRRDDSNKSNITGGNHGMIHQAITETATQQSIDTPPTSPRKKMKTPSKKKSGSNHKSKPPPTPHHHHHKTRRPSGPSPVSLQVLPCFGRNNPAPLAPKLPTSEDTFSEFFHQFMQLEEKARALENANAAMYHKLLALEHSMDSQLASSMSTNSAAAAAATTTATATPVAAAAAATYPCHYQNFYYDNNIDSYGVAAPAGPPTKALLLPEEAAALDDACMLQGIFDDVDDIAGVAI